jgi:hypothetical protein
LRLYSSSFIIGLFLIILTGMFLKRVTNSRHDLTSLISFLSAKQSYQKKGSFTYHYVKKGIYLH